MNETTAASGFERVAIVAHEALDAWRAQIGEPPVGQFGQLPAAHQRALIDGVRMALSGSSPQALHALGVTAPNPVHVSTINLPAYAPLGGDQRKKALLFHTIAITLGCGVERWSVKTLTDTAAGAVNLIAQPATVAELVALPVPAGFGPDMARAPAEQQAYEVTGTITLAKLEADSDVHLVLDDGNGNTMICEAACPSCAAGSRALAQIQAVRQLVEAQFPITAQGGIERGLSVPVTVTGVLFFDVLHGQAGVAPNGVELHPLIAFEVHP